MVWRIWRAVGKHTLIVTNHHSYWLLSPQCSQLFSTLCIKFVHLLIIRKTFPLNRWRQWNGLHENSSQGHSVSVWASESSGVLKAEMVNGGRWQRDKCDIPQNWVRLSWGCGYLSVYVPITIPIKNEEKQTDKKPPIWPLDSPTCVNPVCECLCTGLWV